MNGQEFCTESIKLFVDKLLSGSVIMAYTITLKPRLYKFQSITQYEMTYHDATSLITKTRINGLIATELTKVGNIHYHIVAYGDKIAHIHLINTIRKNRLFGFYTVKDCLGEAMVTNEVRYLFKDVEQTKKILHTPNYKPAIIELL